MGILDSIADDPVILNANIDFSKYALGAKLSTKAREYFEAKKGAYGITGSTQDDINNYFANVLFDRMKMEMNTELEQGSQDTIINTVEAVRVNTEATKAEIESLELVKL